MRVRIRTFALGSDRIGLILEKAPTPENGQHDARQSEGHFRLLVQGVKDYAIYTLDPEGRVLSWNEGAERLMGFRSEEVLGKHYAMFFAPDDRLDGKPEIQIRRARKEGQAEDDGMRLRKDGSQIWVNALMTALRDARGRLYGFAQITRDVTGSKYRELALRAARDELEIRVRERTAELVRVNHELQSEVSERERAEQQLRALAARLQKTQEAERIRIAREIHDALGQLCTALKIDVNFISKRLPRQENRLRAKARSALVLVDELIRSLRRLSSELHPGVLNALGLTAAMEWQAQEFQRRTGIRCRLNLPDKELGLNLERSTALFRIFQEALTNVARHSRAR